LYNASVSLRQQGEENTVDAVHILLRSIRTYMMDYGDSRDRYAPKASSTSLSERDVAISSTRINIYLRRTLLAITPSNGYGLELFTYVEHGETIFIPIRNITDVDVGFIIPHVYGGTRLTA
jgi:hypothetical protein